MNKFLGGVFGCCVGDALGTSVEFMSPEYVKNNPVTDMKGGGKFNLTPGQFTDDSSMCLCVLLSLIRNGDYDGLDIIDLWWKWYDEGYFSSNGECFDIGSTTLKSILYCRKNHTSILPEKVSSEVTGNGSLMRLIPLILFGCFANHQDSCIALCGASSKSTHMSLDGIDACRVMALIIYRIIVKNVHDKDDLLTNISIPIKSKNISNIIKNQTYKTKDKKKDNNNNNNSNYICGLGTAHQTFEAVLWAFYKGQDFKSSVLSVINLGDDADTTGAICGYLCGVFYGFESIPKEWIKTISFKELIEEMTLQLFDLVKQKEEKKKEFTPSSTFISMMKFYDFLHENTLNIKRRLNPCPKQYTSVEDFQEDVEILKKRYFDKFQKEEEEKEKEIMWNQFVRIFQEKEKDLEIKFNNNVDPPPLPPSLGDDNFNFSSTTSDDNISVGVGGRGDLFEEIRAGRFKLKKFHSNNVC